MQLMYALILPLFFSIANAMDRLAQDEVNTPNTPEIIKNINSEQFLRKYQQNATILPYYEEDMERQIISGLRMDKNGVVFQTLDPIFNTSFDLHELSVTSGVFSPDGKKIATTSYDNTLCIYDLESGHNVLTNKHDEVTDHICWSADGSSIYYTNPEARKLFRLDLAQGILHSSVVSNKIKNIQSMDVSSDGSTICLVNQKDKFVLIDVASKKVRLESIKSKAVIFNTALEILRKYRQEDSCSAHESAEIQKIQEDALRTMIFEREISGINNSDRIDKAIEAFVNPKGEYIDESAKKLLFSNFRSFHFTTLKLSPNGRYVAWGTAQHGMLVLRVNFEGPLWVIPFDGKKVTSVDWHPEGKKIAVGLEDGKIGFAESVEDGDSQDFRLSPDQKNNWWYTNAHTNAVISVRWSPDGKFLLTASLDGYIVVVDCDQQKIYTFGQRDGLPMFANWSHDGKRIISGDTNGSVLIWNWDKMQEINGLNLKQLLALCSNQLPQRQSNCNLM